MTATFIQRGDVVNRTLGGTVAAGDVVALRGTIGVYLKGGVSGDVVPVALEGCFTVPKVSGAVWAQGEKLLWDASAAAFDDDAATPAAGDIMGGAVAMAAGANGETTAVVKLTPGNTTLT